MKKEKNALILISALMFLSFLPKVLLAADNNFFSLTYRVIEGGENKMLLNDNKPYYKSVEITITKKDATVSQEFEIYQDAGVGLEKLKGNFKMHRLSQDFPTGGYFDVQTNDATITFGESRIYKSDTAGTGLIFTLAYGLTQPEEGNEIETGEYTVQLNYILRPTSGTLFDQLKEPLYVDISISGEAEAEPKIEITTATGSKVLSLNSQEEEKQAADAIVKFNRRPDKEFSIKQLVLEPLESNEGNQLDYEAIEIQTQEVTKGKGITRQPLSSRITEVYQSMQNGDASDFIITYSLGDLSGQKAGNYESTIQYYLEEEGQATPLDRLELEVENERIFEVALTPEDQKGTVEFLDLKPRQPPKTSEVIIEIKTNLGKPYQLNQNVHSDLTNKEGGTIDSRYFTLRAESIDTQGTLKAVDKQEVKKGDTILFVSDNQGSPDKFRLIYELTCPADLKAGDYSTKITYSLLEI